MIECHRRLLKLEDGARLQKSNVNEILENSGVGEQEIGGEQEEKFGTKGREGRVN